MTAHHLPDPRDGAEYLVLDYETRVELRDDEPVTPPRPRWPLILAIVVVIGAVVALLFRGPAATMPSAEPGAASSRQGAVSLSAIARDPFNGRKSPLSAASPRVAGPLGGRHKGAETAGSATSPVPPLPDTATVLRGTATWCAPTPRYCQSWGGRAKLGAVRSFRWGDKPYSVRVCHGSRCTVVRVVSHCACPKTLIDLSPYAFTRLAPLHRGRIHVTVERISTPGLPVLPPTDTRGG